jgi:hypothetical protein
VECSPPSCPLAIESNHFEIETSGYGSKEDKLVPLGPSKVGSTLGKSAAVPIKPLGKIRNNLQSPGVPIQPTRLENGDKDIGQDMSCDAKQNWSLMLQDFATMSKLFGVGHVDDSVGRHEAQKQCDVMEEHGHRHAK